MGAFGGSAWESKTTKLSKSLATVDYWPVIFFLGKEWDRKLQDKILVITGSSKQGGNDKKMPLIDAAKKALPNHSSLK